MIWCYIQARASLVRNSHSVTSTLRQFIKVPYGNYDNFLIILFLMNDYNLDQYPYLKSKLLSFKRWCCLPTAMSRVHWSVKINGKASCIIERSRS